MDKIEFAAGNEKRFLDFFSRINKDDKIALLSHTDCDGIISGKVTSKSVKYEIIKFINYEEINLDLVKELKKNKISKVITTDLLIKDSAFIDELEKFCEVLIIDHHQIDKDFNSKKTVFMNAQGFCASYLAYYLFFNVAKIKSLEKIDWLVACASLADFAYENNVDWMEKTYKKYNDNFSLDSIKTSIFWNIQLDITYGLMYFKNELHKVFNLIGDKFYDINELRKHSNEVKQEINVFEKNFYKEREEINGRYFWNITTIPKFSISSFIGTITSVKEPNKTTIICRLKDGIYHLSLRRQDKKEDMNKLVKNLIKGLKNADGGGHIPAAGGHFLEKDFEKFKENLKKF